MMDNLVMPTTVTQISQIIVDLIKTQIKTSVHSARTPVSADSHHREVCLDHGQVEHVPLVVVLAMVEQALEEQPPVGDMITRECLDPDPAVGLVANQDSISPEATTKTLVNPGPMRILVSPEEAMALLVSPGPMLTPVSPEEAIGTLVEVTPVVMPFQAVIPVLLALPGNEGLGQVGPVVVPGVTPAPEINSKIKKNEKGLNIHGNKSTSHIHIKHVKYY